MNADMLTTPRKYSLKSSSATRRDFVGSSSNLILRNLSRVSFVSMSRCTIAKVVCTSAREDNPARLVLEGWVC